MIVEFTVRLGLVTSTLFTNYCRHNSAVPAGGTTGRKVGHSIGQLPTEYIDHMSRPDDRAFPGPRPNCAGHGHIQLV